MATFRDGQEAQSGIIRRDPARLRGRRDSPGIGQEAWCASTDGAPSNRELDPARAKEARTEAAEDRSLEGCHRPDAGGDRQAPRKQRHTAHRIWTRLREEHPEFAIAAPTEVACGSTRSSAAAACWPPRHRLPIPTPRWFPIAPIRIRSRRWTTTSIPPPARPSP